MGHVSRLVLLSWGWDAVANAPVEYQDRDGGQGWCESGAFGWRLRHLCLSLRLFGQLELLDVVHKFTNSLGALAPWGENGMGEARYTLGNEGAVLDFWRTRRRVMPYKCFVTASDDRTLREILVTASMWGDV